MRNSIQPRLSHACRALTPPSATPPSSLSPPCPRTNSTELYNLSASPFESDNLLVNAPAGGVVEQQAAKMRATLLQWVGTLDPINAAMDANKHLGCAEYALPTGHKVFASDDAYAFSYPARDPWD